MPDRGRERLRTTTMYIAGVVDELNRMRTLGRSGHGSSFHTVRAHAWVPTANVFPRGDDLVIELELAGLGPGDIHVSLDGKTLVIAGETPIHIEAEGHTFLVRERSEGPFERRIELPEGTPDNAVSAELANGLVEITVRGGARPPRQQAVPLHERFGRVPRPQRRP